MTIGTEKQPLRVAIIGAGPAGFYVADHLLKQKELAVEVDMFDRLPTPFGLVRHGVAPDHQKIKMVSRVFEKVAGKHGFRFFGNVECGTHITNADLKQHYHQIVYTTGAQTDRKLNIPGEDLQRSHPATDFVAWYNGHPDYRHLEFDLSHEKIAVIGVGNVAVDVCRLLCHSADNLAQTDIADYALEAFRKSNVKEVYMLGRRGPAQAAFSVQEIKELGKLPDAEVRTLSEEVELDELSKADLEANPDRTIQQKLEVLQGYANTGPVQKSRTLTMRFLVSPVELIDDGQGGVGGMKIVRNELYRTDDGGLRPRATDHYETLDVGMVFRSIGYHGVPLKGVPFDAKRGVIPNEQGRVIDPETSAGILGEYAAGWIKRGPTGLIGTNKPDAEETVKRMLADLEAGDVLDPASPDPATIDQVIRERQADLFSYEDWKQLDAHETSRGEALGRPRVKLTSLEEMLDALRSAGAEK
ncbi:MAG: FAD-dependent oxidoreductase [Phycisphaeraceae bacterium]